MSIDQTKQILGQYIKITLLSGVTIINKYCISLLIILQENIYLLFNMLYIFGVVYSLKNAFFLRGQVIIIADLIQGIIVSRNRNFCRWNLNKQSYYGANVKSRLVAAQIVPFFFLMSDVRNLLCFGCFAAWQLADRSFLLIATFIVELWTWL